MAYCIIYLTLSKVKITGTIQVLKIPEAEKVAFIITAQIIITDLPRIWKNYFRQKILPNYRAKTTYFMSLTPMNGANNF